MARTRKKPNEMSFLDHLEELRWILVRTSAVILILGAAVFAVSDFIFDEIIFGPTRSDFVTYQLLCEASQALGFEDAICITDIKFVIQNTAMEGQINILVWVCIMGGFILGFPYLLWELWRFISPALYQNEKRNAKTFILSSSILFFLGVLFGYFVIIPMSVNFFASFSVSDAIKNEFNLQSYIGMVKTSLIACGLFFELPIIVYFLTRLGLVTPEFLRKYWRYAVVIILIVAAIVTPPDVVSQIIVTIPMLIIYEISILISKVVVRREKSQTNLPKKI